MILWSCTKAVCDQFRSSARYQFNGPANPPAEKACTYSAKWSALIHGGRVASSAMVSSKATPSGMKPVDFRAAGVAPS